MLSYLLRIMELFYSLTMAHPIRVYLTDKAACAYFRALGFGMSLMFSVIMYYCYFKTDASLFRINIGLFRHCRKVNIIMHNPLSVSFLSHYKHM